MTGVDLLDVLKNKDVFLKYRKYIKSHAIDEHVDKILQGMENYFDAFPTATSINWVDFSTWFLHVYAPTVSSDEAKVFSLIFNNLSTYTVTQVTETVIDYFVKMDAIATAMDGLTKIAEGDNKISVNDVKDILDHYLSTKSVTEDEYELTTHGLTNLIDSVVRTGGFEWNLEDLNRSIGPLHRGDLVIVAARPETGKTSFICNELVYMIPQAASDGRDAIIFNNEEAESKIRLRLYNTALNKPVYELTKNEVKAQADYVSKVGRIDRIRIVGKAGLHTRDVEYYLKKYKPAIAVINVMHKLRGFDRIKSDVERLGKLYNWAREKAKEFDCALVLVAQADASAENQMWIYQNQIYGSKTEVQGEADVMITIGMVHDASAKDIRYIHVPKNKMPPGPRTDPALKHGYHEVAFNNETGVFSSKVYKTRS